MHKEMKKLLTILHFHPSLESNFLYRLFKLHQLHQLY